MISIQGNRYSYNCYSNYFSEVLPYIKYFKISSGNNVNYIYKTRKNKTNGQKI